MCKLTQCTYTSRGGDGIGERCFGTKVDTRHCSWVLGNFRVLHMVHMVHIDNKHMPYIQVSFRVGVESNQTKPNQTKPRVIVQHTLNDFQYRASDDCESLSCAYFLMTNLRPFAGSIIMLERHTKQVAAATTTVEMEGQQRKESKAVRSLRITRVNAKKAS
jgi:hypothetical protein